MIIGELYLVKQYYWSMFPTKELAGRAGEGAADPDDGLEGAQRYAKWLSERYNCNVSFFEPKTYVVLLEESKNCYKLLDCNGNVGWIRCWDFSDYFKLVKANQ